MHWFDPKPEQAALKVVAGASFGVIGVLAVATGFLVVATGFLVAACTLMWAALLLGIVFGYSQKTATWAGSWTSTSTSTSTPTPTPTPTP